LIYAVKNFVHKTTMEKLDGLWYNY